MLTADDRRRTDYSKYRLKRVGERDNSEEVAFLFPRPSDASKTAAANDALTRMGNAISEWWSLTEGMRGLDSLNLARDTLKDNRPIMMILKQFEANAPNFLLDYSPSRIPKHIKRKLLGEEGEELNITSTSRGETDAVEELSDDSENSEEFPAKKVSKGSKAFDILKFAQDNPLAVEIFRKNFHRTSGKPLFKKYNAKIVSFTNHTITFDNKLIIRQSDISIKLKSPIVSD